MLGVDVWRTERARFVSGKEDTSARLFGVSLKHRELRLHYRAAGRGARPRPPRHGLCSMSLASTSRAAFWAALFFENPSAWPTQSRPKRTSIVNVLECSGPRSLTIT